jgi:hypothetical protein
MMAAALTVLVPGPAHGQLLGGLLDQPLANLLGAPARGTTRVIIRTERGALTVVLRLVAGLGGRVLAQHKLIDAVTVELPALQLALVVRVPGVLSVSIDSPVASAPSSTSARRNRAGRAWRPLSRAAPWRWCSMPTSAAAAARRGSG